MKQFQLPFSSFAGKRLRQLELLLMSAYHKKKNEAAKKLEKEIHFNWKWLESFYKCLLK